jgi:hypothetical protein
MKNPTLRLTAALAMLIAASAIGQTQPATSGAAPATPPPSGWDQWCKDVKNPASWFSWGADVRLRNEYFDNAYTLNETIVRHEQDYFRFRERVWTSFIPLKGLSLNARLAAEQREWMKPSFASQYGNSSIAPGSPSRSGLEERYIILDNLNVKYNDIGGSGISVAGGRQDIMFGDPLNWWLVADGTPGDGSWTFFLDSIRASYEAKDIKTKFDVIYIYQSALPDDWMPTIGRSGENRNPMGTNPPVRPYSLTEQDEQGAIFYASTKAVNNMQIDAYFIYKHDNRIAEITSGDNADIYTLGAKISGTPTKNWFYSLEGAYQFGWKEDSIRDGSEGSSRFAARDIRAYGANGKLTYLFKDKLNNQVSLVGEWLSGDDPGSAGTDEMFDVLWGRWPRWSELYIYSYVLETSGKIAQLNNVARIGCSWGFTPVKNLSFSATYNALLAPEKTPSRALVPARFSGDGSLRGHLLQTVLKYQINKNVSTHLWGECVWQGDYYAQRDLMTFLRAEVMLTF